jgi:thiol:disulfide interchange protein DsbD
MKVLLRTTLIAAATILTASLGLSGLVRAKPWWMRGVESNESDFLAPDVAFRVGARIDGNALRVHWMIADGYYLYRQKMQIQAESPDLLVSAPTFPRGILKTDPYLGTQEIFLQQVEGSVAFHRFDAGAHPIQIKVTYQGCAEAGLCYPPISKVLFPDVAAPMVRAQPHPWEGIAIISGGLAFLLAGFVLRKGRRLDMPV